MEVPAGSGGCHGQVRSGLEPIKKVAGTIKDHLWGILKAAVLEVVMVRQKVSKAESR
ncbi:transposase [Candidatus Vondammii sp. HM_W22]|uniref:transposase n=1 Tax=Candidatus Vondammii sp. HM_W22 TaxID=2687299 RepID=UPI001F12FB36|nr:transposase [Candidatus Vondammii sp. HM_W22]